MYKIVLVDITEKIAPVIVFIQRLRQMSNQISVKLEGIQLYTLKMKPAIYPSIQKSRR